MHILVTGAGGFVGRALCPRLFAAYPGADVRFTLVDRAVESPSDPRATTVAVDLGPDSSDLDALTQDAEVVVHLAAVPGGAAERDPVASERVNLQLTLGLLDRLGGRAKPVRFVYASTIAVFGEPMPVLIDDATRTLPTMTYGAHKLMIETALCDRTRRGEIDGLAIRLPGLVARPAGGSGMKSAFMSELFHACAGNRAFTVPTGPDATVWIMSVAQAADNLLHATKCARPGAGVPRAFTLPALRVRMQELAEAVARRAGSDPSLIAFEPDVALEAQFGRLPPLATPLAESLGFAHDGDLDSLVARTFEAVRVGSR